MKHRRGFNPLSRRSAHRRALSRNMVTSLFKYERITTTKPKAMEIRRSAEKLITRAKVDSVHNRRQVAKMIWDKAVLNKLFTEIGVRMKERNGGYTRVLKLGFRDGDAAEVAILELIDYNPEDHEEKTKGKTEVKKEPAKRKVSAKEKKTAVNAKKTSAKDAALPVDADAANTDKKAGK